MLYIHYLNTNQFAAALAHAEHEIYIAAYKFTDFNQVRTAKLLGVARGTLRTKLKRWGALVPTYN
jgi:DNA-binding protein Fis